MLFSAARPVKEEEGMDSWGSGGVFFKATRNGRVEQTAARTRWLKL